MRSRRTDDVAQRHARRAVMNDVRREVERHARIAAVSEELLKAAERVLAANEADLQAALDALRAVVAKYRDAAHR